MGRRKRCGRCMHFPLCYSIWHVHPSNPCKFLLPGNHGFFTEKKPLPVGGIVIDVEKLREIEWIEHSISDLSWMECPACGAKGETISSYDFMKMVSVSPSPGEHRPDCWLGNALKEADSG